MTIETNQTPPRAADALTPGAHRAAPGEYFFEVSKLGRVFGGPDYSPTYGGCVEGERMMMAVMRAPKGEYALPHSHPNEQWIYVLDGTFELVVGGVARTANKGDIVYIPANVIHAGGATADQDGIFVTAKDTSHGLQGRPTSFPAESGV